MVINGLFLSLLFIFIGLPMIDTTQMVWMAPYSLIPGSSLLVNASTSLPALSLALQKIYNQGILPNNSIR